MGTAILVLDLINDIVSPKGKISTCAAHVAERHAIQKTNDILRLARQNHWSIVLVKVGFSANYCEQPSNSPVFGRANQLQALQLGQWGTEFHSDLDVSPEDLILIKHRISPFYGTALDLVLRASKTDCIIVCGVSSTWAVQSAVREGHDRDYVMMVAEEACADADENAHQISMRQLSRIASIMTVEQITALSQSDRILK